MKQKKEQKAAIDVKPLLYEGCEIPVTVVRICRGVAVAKCSVILNEVPFEVTMKGVSEADAYQKLKDFLS